MVEGVVVDIRVDNETVSVIEDGVCAPVAGHGGPHEGYQMAGAYDGADRDDFSLGDAINRWHFGDFGESRGVTPRPWIPKPFNVCKEECWDVFAGGNSEYTSQSSN